MEIKVLLADDHVVVREALRTYIESHDGFSVVAEASNGREAYEACVSTAPDVAILDIHMPISNGITATREIKTQYPGIRVLALSFQAQPGVIRDAILAGADGYVLKDSAGEELIAAIRSVMGGRKYYSGRIAEIIVDSFVVQDSNLHEGSGHALLRELSDRETQVLQMLAEGRSNVNIAETYRSRLIQKLKVGSFAELIRIAVRAGLVDQENT